MDSYKKILAIVLAGGEGKRLMPLSKNRAKPAVPFGGIYRLIDFPLSNLVNSGILQIVVLTQYKSHSLDRHIAKTWQLSSLVGEYVAPVPAQQRTGKNWFLGSADAIYQSLNLIGDEKPDIVVVAGADHVYRMDFRKMIDFHIENQKNLTVAGIRQPIELASEFGVIEQDENNTALISKFIEKPIQAKGIKEDPSQILASMGIYVFNTKALENAVCLDAENDDSKHDMGRDIVTSFVQSNDAACYDFYYNNVPGSNEQDKGYWRDVGSLDSYYDANMDLVATKPAFNLYNKKWPIFGTDLNSLPPAKFVSIGQGQDRSVGIAEQSYISSGVIVSGAKIKHSIISPGCYIHKGSVIENSIILDSVEVGRNAIIKNAILDKEVFVGEGVCVGVDKDADAKRGLTVTTGGITVVEKGFKINS